jgi:hypothetical protein
VDAEENSENPKSAHASQSLEKPTPDLLNMSSSATHTNATFGKISQITFSVA